MIFTVPLWVKAFLICINIRERVVANATTDCSLLTCLPFNGRFLLFTVIVIIEAQQSR